MRKQSLCAWLLVAAALCGCTSSTGYHTVQHMARQSCLKQPPSEQALCEARLNRKDHDSYEKERAAAR